MPPAIVVCEYLPKVYLFHIITSCIFIVFFVLFFLKTFFPTLELQRMEWQSNGVSNYQIRTTPLKFSQFFIISIFNALANENTSNWEWTKSGPVGDLSQGPNPDRYLFFHSAVRCVLVCHCIKNYVSLNKYYLASVISDPHAH